MAGSLLQVTDLSVSYHAGQWALRNLNLTLTASQTVALMGGSGSGKTTAAWAIQGLLPKSANVNGSIRLAGEEIVNASEKTLAKLRGHVVSMVSQEPSSALNPVAKIGHQMRSVAGGQTRTSVLTMLERLGLPAHFYDAYPHQLSGGQLQRVVIGQALLCKPQILVADEPAAALDSVTRASIVELLREWQKEFGFALLLITHQPELVTGWASQIVTLGTAQSPTTSQRSPPPTITSQTVLQVNNLKKAYPRIQALSGATLNINLGARFIISGESGSGKSTLAKCIAGWETADTGTVAFTTKQRPQLIPQEPGESLNPFWPTWEVVSESLRLQGISKTERRTRAEEWIQRVGLPPAIANRKSTTGSGGERARIAIARALLNCECDQQNPALLIFDESFSGLDLPLRAQMRELLAELQQRWPLAYIVITHDTTLAQTFGNQWAVMTQGRLSP